MKFFRSDRAKYALVLAVVVLLTVVVLTIVAVDRKMSQYKHDSDKYRSICLYVKIALTNDAREIQRRGSLHQRMIERVYNGEGPEGYTLLTTCAPAFDLQGWNGCKQGPDTECLARILTEAARSIAHP